MSFSLWIVSFVVLAEIEYEAPNNNLGRFEGTLKWKGKELPLKNENVLLRGTRLRNTQWAFGSKTIEKIQIILFFNVLIKNFSCLLCWSRYEINEK